MGYVGNQQAEGFVQRPTKQDLTGATGTSLTLSHAVSKEEDIDLYINNVKQEPTTAYTVADTAVTLTGSVVATDDIYVVYNSLALQTVTPPDGSVSTAKLANNSVTMGKLATSGTLPALDGGSLTNVGTVIGTPVSLNGLSETEYTSLPSDVSAIDVTFSAASIGTADGFIGVQLGTASGYETSSYYVANPYMAQGGTTSAGHNTNYADFRLYNFGNVSNVIYFHMRIMNHGSNNWFASGHGYTEYGSYYMWLTGYKSLSDTLTKVKIKTATGNFDAGTVNLNYER